MRTSLFKNLRLQTYLQVINSIIPLLTTPYISRVLGANNIGIFSSYHAIASFFTLFAVFGMGTYGTRCISAESDEKKQKSLFIELYILQLITCSISTIFYLAYCLFFANNSEMAFLQLITLFGCFIDISWFYYGIENFEFVVVINTVFRVLSVFALFLFVRDGKDLFAYTIIMLGSAFVSQLVLWLELVRKNLLSNREYRKKNIKNHIVPNLMLFVPLIAMTICNNTDKAMLGILSTYDQAGFYANTDRIINVPYSLFLGIGTVFLPRMTSLYNISKEKAKDYFFVTLSGVIMLGVAICFGIISVSQSFIIMFLGPGYEPCIALVKVFSGIIIIKSISNAIRMHYLVPFKKELIYIAATVIGAIINIILNYLMIPRYGALGAVLATLISESIVLVIQVFRVFTLVELKSSIIDLIAYICIGLVMVFVLTQTNTVFVDSKLEIIIDVILGMLIFCLMTLIYWNTSHNKLYVLYIKNRIAKLFSMFL